jgi:hypothetical protein
MLCQGKKDRVNCFTQGKDRAKNLTKNVDVIKKQPCNSQKKTKRDLNRLSKQTKNNTACLSMSRSAKPSLEKGKPQ